MEQSESSAVATARRRRRIALLQQGCTSLHLVVLVGAAVAAAVGAAWCLAPDPQLTGSGAGRGGVASVDAALVQQRAKLAARLGGDDMVVGVEVGADGEAYSTSGVWGTEAPVWASAGPTLTGACATALAGGIPWALLVLLVLRLATHTLVGTYLLPALFPAEYTPAKTAAPPGVAPASALPSAPTATPARPPRPTKPGTSLATPAAPLLPGLPPELFSEGGDDPMAMMLAALQGRMPGGLAGGFDINDSGGGSGGGSGMPPAGGALGSLLASAPGALSKVAAIASAIMPAYRMASALASDAALAVFVVATATAALARASG